MDGYIFVRQRKGQGKIIEKLDVDVNKIMFQDAWFSLLNIIYQKKCIKFTINNILITLRNLSVYVKSNQLITVEIMKMKKIRRNVEIIY